MAESTFRILSIDGGGVRGYLAAEILANVEAYLDRATATSIPLGLRFDLIAGTSAGGLLALGLALGQPAHKLRNLLLELIPRVFGKERRRTLLGWLRRPRYSAPALEAGLESVLGKHTLADLQRDACITSVSLIDAKPRLHKTDYFARNAGRLDETLVDVAMATSAAPTYSPARDTKHSANLVDGGFAANNPAVVAITDALQFERASKRGTCRPQLDGKNGPVLLSIGTGQPGPLPYDYRSMVNGGALAWALPVREVVLLAQSQLVHFQAKFLVGDRYLRVDPVLNVPVRLDDVDSFRELRNKADVDAACEAFLKQNFT